MTKTPLPLARGHGTNSVRAFVLACAAGCAAGVLAFLATSERRVELHTAAVALVEPARAPAAADAPAVEIVAPAARSADAPADAPPDARARPDATLPAGDPPFVLRVSAEDASGRALAAATVQVAHALRGLGDPADRREIVLRDVVLPVDVEIPPDRRRAELTVSASGHRPAFQEIGQLRVLAGRWLNEDERHVREVRVRLERERSAVERVYGSVRVDGQARLPRGLRVDVRPGSLLPSAAAAAGDESVARASSPAAAAPAAHRSAPQRALLDPYALEYEAEVVRAGPHVLSITSEETVPRSLEFVVPDDLASVRHDLDLASGVRLEVAVARARERTRIEGLEVRLEHVRIEAETSAFRLRRTHTLLAVTGADGVARFAGLPPGARATAFATLREEGRAPREGQVEVDLPLDPSGVATCRLWVGGPSPDACVVFGALDPAWADGGGVDALRVAWQEVDRPQSLQRRPLGADAWEFPSNPDRDLLVWIERDGRRVTERAAVRTRAGRAGPVRFAPADVSELRVSWTGAPVGWEMQVLAGEPPAAATPPTKRRIDAAAGAQIVQRFAGADVGVLATSPAGSRWYRSWPGTSLGPELAFEFPPLRPVEIAAEPAIPGGLTALSLWCLAPDSGAGTCVVRVPLGGGRGIEPVPLATGAHFFRGETADVACWVAGSALASADGCRATWRGSPLPIAARIERGEQGFVLSTCAHGDLGAVPIADRRFRFDDLRASASRLEALLVDAEGCGFLPLHIP